MAKIVEHKNILLDDLTISKGQARTQDTGKDIDSLAESIRVQGLLQPIVVCPAKETGKWEILTGQRRFLAHKMLKEKSILAAVLAERVEEAEAKAISITENLIRRKLSGKDLINGITYLHKIYGNAKIVAEETGLPYQSILDYVKYPRLIPELKKMVDDRDIDINAALKAQDAASQGGKDPDPKIAVELAQGMVRMTGPQRKKLVKEHKEHPGQSVADAIEAAKSGSKVTQVVATVTQDTHAAIQRFAKEEDTNQDEAVVKLIEESLIGRGLLDAEAL